MALRALYATLFAGGLTLLGAGVAHASETSGDDGILSGTQVGISIDLPVTVSGNAISVIGDSRRRMPRPRSPRGGGADPVAVTSGDDGIGSGTQALVDVSAPVTVGGNAISVIGDSSSSDAETVVAPAEPAAASDARIRSHERRGLDPRRHAGAGRRVGTGDGRRQRDLGHRRHRRPTDAATAVASGGWPATAATRRTSRRGLDPGRHAGCSGTVDLPMTVGGNAISGIGDSTSTDATTVVAPGTGGGSATTDGSDGLLGGTQLVPDLSLPITIGGNAISVIGDSETDGSTTIVVPTDPRGPRRSGRPRRPGRIPVDPTDPTEPDRTRPNRRLPVTRGGSTVVSSSGAKVAAGLREARFDGRRHGRTSASPCSPSSADWRSCSQGGGSRCDVDRAGSGARPGRRAPAVMAVLRARMRTAWPCRPGAADAGRR